MNLALLHPLEQRRVSLIGRHLNHGKGDQPAPNASESMNDILSAYQKNLPGLAQTTAAQVLPYERALLEAQKEIQPQYTAQQVELYKKYGPELNAIGQMMAESNARSQAANEAGILTGAGKDLVTNARALQEQVDPEFYKLRALGATKYADLLNSYDPNKLTPGTSSEIERNLNRQGNQLGLTATPTSTNTISSALTYGQGLQNQRSALSNVLAQLPNQMQSSRSGIDVMQTAVGRGSAPAQGQNQLLSYNQTPFGQPVQQMGNQLFGAASTLQGQKNALDDNNLSGLEKVHKGIIDVIGSCCFIFMEAYNGQLPWFVRFWRDVHAPESSARRNGYIKMAKWLVPAMQRSKIVRWLVNTLMIKPMTKFGGWRIAEKGYKYNPIYHIINNFWFKAWTIYGK